MKLLTTKEAAERLGVTVQRVHALLRTGRLPAEKMGRDYLIREDDLKLVQNRRPGRPRTSKKAPSVKKGREKSGA